VSTPDDEVGYAAALAELEEILDQLEDDNIDVDVLSSKVERAAELIRLCRGRIRAAQMSVEEIVAELDDLADDGVDTDTSPDSDD
jgi:exodeoxyribonuclease VII small subunit